MARHGRLRILHAIHDFLPRHRAGSELYAFHLCRELLRRHDVTVLCAEYAPEVAHGTVRRRRYEGLPVVELTNNWAFRSFAETYRSPLLGERLDGVLDELAPDVLHLHSVLNLSMDLPRLAARRGVPVVATLHDHHLVCPAGGQRVHVAERHVCRDVDPRRCSRCFVESPFHAQMAAGAALARIAGAGAAASPWGERVRALLTAAARVARRRAPRTFAALLRLNRASVGRLDGVTPTAIAARLAYLEELYRHVDLFVAPSQALAREHVRLGLPESRLEVSDYGFVPLARPRARRPRRPLTLGFVGTLVWHKGVHVLLAAARDLPPDRFVVKVFGDLDTFPDYVVRLRRLAADLPVQFMGGFAHEQAAEAYAQLDVLVVPSLWPENSPLVIHEAFMAGVPVVAAREGGIADLVEHGRNGLLYDSASPAALAAALRGLLEEPRRLARLRAAAPAVKTIAADAAEWEERYRRLVAGRPRRSRA
jgi:glycosyltransferase involved in cell wall biosynthesis